jgi:hypothetical protein
MAVERILLPHFVTGIFAATGNFPRHHTPLSVSTRTCRSTEHEDVPIDGSTGGPTGAIVRRWRTNLWRTDRSHLESVVTDGLHLAVDPSGSRNSPWREMVKDLKIGQPYNSASVQKPQKALRAKAKA